MTFKLLILAPMEGFTDPDFRTKCYRHGADLTITEVARVDNLAKQKSGELKRIQILDSTPTQIQLAGAKISSYERFLSVFKAEEGFRGFNLNLGCSSPEFLGQGIGCAMVKRITRVDEIVKLIVRSGYECSIKMRLGLDDYEKRKKTYLNLIENVTDASFFVVHPRTAEQTLDNRPKNRADFSVYPECVETGKLIVANGDIRTTGQIKELKRIGLFGAMIGRAAIDNPGIFHTLRMD